MRNSLALVGLVTAACSSMTEATSTEFERDRLALIKEIVNDSRDLIVDKSEHPDSPGVFDYIQSIQVDEHLNVGIAREQTDPVTASYHTISGEVLIRRSDIKIDTRGLDCRFGSEQFNWSQFTRGTELIYFMYLAHSNGGMSTSNPCHDFIEHHLPNISHEGMHAMKHDHTWAYEKAGRKRDRCYKNEGEDSCTEEDEAFSEERENDYVSQYTDHVSSSFQTHAYTIRESARDTAFALYQGPYTECTQEFDRSPYEAASDFVWPFLSWVISDFDCSSFYDYGTPEYEECFERTRTFVDTFNDYIKSVKDEAYEQHKQSCAERVVENYGYQEIQDSFPLDFDFSDSE